MAIVQASLAEEILSRQERAVLRGIYRAAQLSEGLVAIRRVYDSLIDGAQLSANSNRVSKPIEDYIAQQIMEALANTKVPANSSKKSTLQAVKTA